MRTAIQLLDALQAAGATVVVEGGKARVRGAKPPDELLAEVKARREEVLAEVAKLTEADRDRFQRVPTGEVPMFGRDLASLPVKMTAAIECHVLRQPKPVQAWMQCRADEYFKVGLPHHDVEWRACVDVIAWQRNTAGRQAVEWLEGVEEAGAACTQLLKAKTKEQQELL